MALTGCASGGGVNYEYANARWYRIAVDAPALDSVEVRFHPNDPARANIRPSAGGRTRLMLANTGDDWNAHPEAVRSAYAKALAIALQAAGRDCTIASEEMFRRFYMIDYRLNCSTEIAPVMNVPSAHRQR